MSEDHEHCWHSIGSGISHGWGGGEDMICCTCGAPGVRRWGIEYRPVEGHGEFFKERVKTYSPTEPVA